MNMPIYSRGVRRSERAVTVFGGINRRANAAEGELQDSENLSAAETPMLTQRGARTSLGGYRRATAMTAWDGLVVVDGTDLLYDGSRVGAVTAGDKQFAVINTKLCIFPDKKYLDLATNRLRELEGTFAVSANTATFSTGELSISASAPKLGTTAVDAPYASAGPKYTMVYTAVSWVDGTWARTGGTVKSLNNLAVGDVLIPKAGDMGSYELITKTTDAGTGYAEDENVSGIYWVVTAAASTGTTECKWEKFNSVRTARTYYTQDGWQQDWSAQFEPTYSGSGYSNYSFSSSTGRFTGTGSKAVSGTGGGTYYKGGGDYIEKYVVSAGSGSCTVTKSTRFAEGPFTSYSYAKGSTSYGYVYAEEDTYPTNGRYASDGYWYTFIEETGFDGTVSVALDVMDAAGANGKFTQYFAPGDVLTITGSSHDVDRKPVTAVTDTTLTFADGTFTAGADGAAFTVKRPVPDLDYICQKGNRLWGVSNAESGVVFDAVTGEFKDVPSRVVYASALGDPTNFCQYNGVSTDSYAVAVASDGDFTGCTGDWGDCVLLWKERRLHVVYGSYPEEFSISEYAVNGLQAGSHKSQRVINKVLYYKGVDGVYAWSGGTPQLVSYKLGDTRFSYAAAGSDGFRYYISMQDDTGAWGLWVYDTLKNIWMREDGTHAVDFTYYNGHVAFLTDGGAVYQAETGVDSDLQWRAEFTPLYEDTTGKKEYTALYLRLDMSAGSTVTLSTAKDGGSWVKQKTIAAKSPQVVMAPIRPTRCDKLRIRLEGAGPCEVLGVVREFRTGSMV